MGISICFLFNSPLQVSQAALLVKNLPANAGDLRDVGSIPGSGSSPGGGHGNPLQYSCLENPTDRGAWRPPGRRVAKSQTCLKWLSMHADVTTWEASDYICYEYSVICVVFRSKRCHSLVVQGCSRHRWGQEVGTWHLKGWAEPCSFTWQSRSLSGDNTACLFIHLL